MTRTGEREICSVSGRLPDNPGELARMLFGKSRSLPFSVASLKKICTWGRFGRERP